MHQDECSARIRVLLADDHPAVREGVRRLLEGQADLKVVAAATDGVEAVEAALRLRPDVVVMDMAMPRLNGIEAIRQIRVHDPHVRIIGLSMHTEPCMAAAMRQAGADDYLAKTCAPQELIASVRQASAALPPQTPATPGSAPSGSRIGAAR